MSDIIHTMLYTTFLQCSKYWVSVSIPTIVMANFNFNGVMLTCNCIITTPILFAISGIRERAQQCQHYSYNLLLFATITYYRTDSYYDIVIKPRLREFACMHV